MRRSREFWLRNWNIQWARGLSPIAATALDLALSSGFPAVEPADAPVYEESRVFARRAKTSARRRDDGSSR
jgi:hypothetical protein